MSCSTLKSLIQPENQKRKQTRHNSIQLEPKRVQSNPLESIELQSHHNISRQFNMHEIKLNQLNSKQIKSIRIGLNPITSNQLSPRAAPRSSVGRRASGARQLARAAGRAPGHDGSIVPSNVGVYRRARQRRASPPRSPSRRRARSPYRRRAAPKKRIPTPSGRFLMAMAKATCRRS